MAKTSVVDVDSGAAVVVVAVTSATPTAPVQVFIHNNEAADAILYLGDDNTVSSATGFPVGFGDTVEVVLTEPGAVYGISSHDNTDVRVFQSRA